MNEHIRDALIENAEVALDNLIDNEVIQEIPVLGTSVKVIKGFKSMRDRAYIKKVHSFITNLGEISDKQRRTLVEESKKDHKRRIKFGEALFSVIEQSDSLVKTEYLAVIFEAFLDENINDVDLRILCHNINICSTDVLVDFIEEEYPKTETLNSLSNSSLVYSSLVTNKRQTDPLFGNQSTSLFSNSPTHSEYFTKLDFNIARLGHLLRSAWNEYKSK